MPSMLPSGLRPLRLAKQLLHPACWSRCGATYQDPELRLLPLLTSHLTFGEIGGRLQLSPHTVKTQAVSIYRKLGVSSRSQAIHHAQQLGLLPA
jgi:ATP/maltotriose-dependent transcriptional regulator MalT